MPAETYPVPLGGIVLCIDDNQEVLECERAFLEELAYTVLTASSGGKGLEMASIHSVDVVILDYFMPAMNGQQVAMEMRRLRPLAPIILLTEGQDVPEPDVESNRCPRSQGSFGQPIVARDRTLARMRSDPSTFV